MSRVVVVDDASFDSLVLAEDVPVLVDFWADWCVPCRMLAPTLEELASDLEDVAVIAKLNVDANPSTAKQYNIRALPTLLVFKDGQVVSQFAGVQAKAVLRERLMKHV